MNAGTSKESQYMSIDSNPYYFNHFINMGRHNAYLIIQHIYKSVYKEEANLNEENALGALAAKVRNQSRKKPDEISKVTDLLIHHFPFLAYYENKERERDNPDNSSTESHGSLAVLTAFLSTLKEIRNETAHYKHPKKDISLSDYKGLFQEGIKEAKGRMKYEDKDVKHLYIKDYYELINNKQFTEAGISYFICLFLDKKNGYLFLSRIKGFKDRNKTSERYKSATLEAFTQFHCHVPYPKLDSSDIAMDMLNELSRCPKQLYQVLSNEDQKSFIATTSARDEDSDIPEPIMKRSEDRFPYFALRYFEKSGQLDKITFQLYLGRKYAKESHTKIINGTERTHLLLKNMHEFGKLPFYKTTEAHQFYENHQKVEFYAPAFRMVGNRIGLILRDKAQEGYDIPLENNHPDAILSTHELNGLFFYNYLYKKGWIEKSTQMFIRNYLNQFKRFINDLQNKKIDPVTTSVFTGKRKKHKKEDLDILYENNQKLQNLLNDYGLEIDWIPDACREYLLNYRPSSDKYIIENKFVKMKRDAERKLARIRAFAEAEKEGTIRMALNRKQLRIGELAQELARDIVFLTPPQKTQRDTKKKINNMEFDILQKMLAYFSVHKDELKRYFGILKDKNNRWKHPFLYWVISKIDSYSSLTEMYEAYYCSKIKWLKKEILNETRESRGYKTSLKDPKAIAEKYEYILKLEQKTKSAIEKSYSDKAVYLPVSLFTAEIVKALRQQGYDLKENSSVAGCLMKYFREKKQPMYELPRYYSTGELDSDKTILSERDEIKKYISAHFQKAGEEEAKAMKKVAKRIRENEIEILRQEANDRALFLMVNNLIPASSFREEDIERLGFNQQNNILDAEYEMSELIYGRRVTARLPIKRYGEFRRFLKDRRLKNLMKYYPEGEDIKLGIIESGQTQQKGEKYKYSNLAEELEIYDKERDKLLALMYNVEKILIDKHSDKIKKTKNSYYNHYDCLEAAKKLGATKEVELLAEKDFKELRNSMLHNQIPFNTWIKESIDKVKDQPMITKRIIDLISEVYSRLEEHLILKTEETA